MSHETRPDRVVQSLPAENLISCRGCEYEESPELCYALTGSIEKIMTKEDACRRRIWRRIG